MALIGNRYTQSTDPGAVGTGYQWLNSTTGNLYERNTTNTAWNSAGNVNLSTLGALMRTGGVMSGPITGVTGWAPLDSPDFTTVAKLSGVNLATVNDLTALQTALEARIKAEAQAAVATALGGVSGSQNIAIGFGTLVGATATTPVTILLPTFPDGVQATQAQCKWVVAPLRGKTGDTADAFYQYFRDSSDATDLDPTTSLSFCAYHAKSDRSLKSATTVFYLIIGVR